MKRLAKLGFALDLLWLLALAAFVFAIPPTFHGDEPMQISMSRDYATAFLDGNPAALVTEPPYPIDSDQNLRLINGSINRYAIGLSWHLAGFTVNDLPPRPGWDWGLDYATNVSTGHMPSAALLAASRFSSTLFLALSVAVMFALGWQFGKRPLAYFVSALYTLNPVTLLDGRRALQEGSMLCFGVLAILVAALISKRLSRSAFYAVSVGARRAVPVSVTRPLSAPIPIWLWLALILASGLTLAAKQSGIVLVAGAFGWIFFAEAVRWRRRDFLLTTAKLILSGVLAIALFVALSPALWNNPPARVLDLLQARSELLDIQVASDPLAPTPLIQRVEGILTQPFMTPPQQYEVAFWANFQPVTDDIARYMASPFSGVQFGVILGGALTLLAGIGILFSLRRDWRVGMIAWLLVTAASLIANPLPWQRYYLPLYPAASLLAGIGLYGLLRRFVWKPEPDTRSALSHAAP